jgi:tetratricopeptide (TPR) repeat protein
MKYVRLLFFPFGQNLDYDIPLSESLFEGYTFLCALCIAVLFFGGIKLTSHYPLLGFGILWFFLALSITSSIVPLQDWIFEHRLYLPMVGFALVLCTGLFYLIKNPRIAVLCLTGFILILSFLTYQRNAIWTDSVKLWEDTVRKSPQKARPYIQLGKAYRWRREYDKAEKYYLRALELLPDHPKRIAQVYINLSAIYGELKEYQKGIAYCIKAIELDPKNPQAYSNAGYSYILIRNSEKALEFGKKAVELDPQFDEGLNNLGIIYAKMGSLEKAAELFKRTLEINPYYGRAQKNLNLTLNLLQKGDSGK